MCNVQFAIYIVQLCVVRSYSSEKYSYFCAPVKILIYHKTKILKMKPDDDDKDKKDEDKDETNLSENESDFNDLETENDESN